MSKGHQRYLEVNLLSTRQAPFINRFSSAVNVFIKHIAAIRSFPTYVVCHSNPFSFELIPCYFSYRHINGRLSTSIIHTMPHCLITTGPRLLCQIMALCFANGYHSLKVPAIRSVLEYFKCAIHCILMIKL